MDIGRHLKMLKVVGEVHVCDVSEGERKEYD
jgi:hypothetical protein